MTACFNGHKDIVRLLLDHLDIIDLNAKDCTGMTALMQACFNGHKDVVKLFLDHSEKN